ncbi:MAG: hypothetical protein N3D12_01265 [Candidatus Methanomethyliaceae archaeon]|nr:hypothetical protein [Candidatus Methanomethyliaceae archaeon]
MSETGKRAVPKGAKLEEKVEMVKKRIKELQERVERTKAEMRRNALFD